MPIFQLYPSSCSSPSRGKLYLLLAFLFACHSHSQTLFSLERYDVPQCDPSTVSHTIDLATTPPYASLPRARTLRLITQLDSSALPLSDTLMVLDASIFRPAQHLMLLRFIQRGHLIVLNTSAPAAADPERQLLADLAVFETLTGLLLPFYTTPDPNVNATVPLFHILLPKPPSSPVTFVRQDAHAMGATNETVSVLDAMDAPQLLCLLARLECHAVAPEDLTFRMCAATVARLHTLTATTTGSPVTLPPNLSQLTHGIQHPAAAAAAATPASSPSPHAATSPSLAARRARLRAAFTLAAHGAPDKQVRDVLFLRREASHALEERSFHEDVGGPRLSWVARFVLWLVPFSPRVCRMLAAALLLFCVVRAAACSRLGREVVAAGRSALRNAQPGHMLSHAIANRAKIT